MFYEGILLICVFIRLIVKHYLYKLNKQSIYIIKFSVKKERFLLMRVLMGVLMGVLMSVKNIGETPPIFTF